MSETEATAEAPAGIDWISALMALTASVLIGVSAYGWLMGGKRDTSKADRPGVASVAPALHLVDPNTGESVVLVGLQGKVVWISFVSASAKTARSEYAALSQVWKRLHVHQKFAMAVVASPTESREQLKGLMNTVSEKFPTYIASEETASAFGAQATNLPFHLLIDPTGKVAAIGGDGMIDRLAKDATRWLDEIEPSGWTRFALAD